MTVKLMGLLFNHDRTAFRSSAINIRKNVLTPAPQPEWTPATPSPDASFAAYATQEIDAGSLYILGRFQSQSFRGSKVQVRTVVTSPPELPVQWQDWLNSLVFTAPLAYQALRAYLAYIFQLLAELTDDVLGSVPPTEVEFDARGESDWVKLPLPTNRLATAGVGIHRATFAWQYRSAAQPIWRDFQLTQHKIYTILKVPTAPWTQLPYSPLNTQLPWADALDWACRWASTATTADGAAAQITRAIYDLGDEKLAYGCPIGAISVYSEPFFQLTSFLDYLRGGLGRGGYVNCSDCATFVSTFANLVGADLWQSQMRDYRRAFPVNPIRAIGSDVWIPPCGIGLFAYHEVAWTGRAEVDNDVYDACLEVDSSPDLLITTPMLPIGLRFGKPGEGTYRDLLCAPWGRDLCEPRPELKRRRFVM